MSTHPDLFHQLQLELEQRELVSLSQVAIATKKEQKETDCHPIGWSKMERTIGGPEAVKPSWKRLRSRVSILRCNRSSSDSFIRNSIPFFFSHTSSWLASVRLNFPFSLRFYCFFFNKKKQKRKKEEEEDGRRTSRRPTISSTKKGFTVAGTKQDADDLVSGYRLDVFHLFRWVFTGFLLGFPVVVVTNCIEFLKTLIRLVQNFHSVSMGFDVLSFFLLFFFGLGEAFTGFYWVLLGFSGFF